jgi:hypothetical protein
VSVPKIHPAVFVMKSTEDGSRNDPDLMLHIMPGSGQHGARLWLAKRSPIRAQGTKQGRSSTSRVSQRTATIGSNRALSAKRPFGYLFVLGVNSGHPAAPAS